MYINLQIIILIAIAAVLGFMTKEWIDMKKSIKKDMENKQNILNELIKINKSLSTSTSDTLVIKRNLIQIATSLDNGVKPNVKSVEPIVDNKSKVKEQVKVQQKKDVSKKQEKVKEVKKENKKVENKIQPKQKPKQNKSSKVSTSKPKDKPKKVEQPKPKKETPKPVNEPFVKKERKVVEFNPSKVNKVDEDIEDEDFDEIDSKLSRKMPTVSKPIVEKIVKSVVPPKEDFEEEIIDDEPVEKVVEQPKVEETKPIEKPKEVVKPKKVVEKVEEKPVEVVKEETNVSEPTEEDLERKKALDDLRKQWDAEEKRKREIQERLQAYKERQEAERERAEREMAAFEEQLKNSN